MQKYLLTVCFFCLLAAFTTFRAFSQPEKDIPVHTRPIVFIHGLFQNNHSWDNWKTYFKDRGFTVYAPSYPFHDGDPAYLRQYPDSGLVTLEFDQVLDHFNRMIDSLPVKPIVIGHSMGGLLMQKLIESERAFMGIGLAPANPRGVSTADWRYFRSNFRMVNPLRSRNKVCRPPLRWFRYTFFNTLPDSLASREYANYFVPESRRIAKSSTGKKQAINFSKPHAPMLFVAGENDNDLPPSLIFNNYKAYTDPNSVRQYHQFPGKSHYLASEPGWELVADYVHQWILQTATPSPVQD